MAGDRVLEMLLVARDKATEVFKKVGTSMDKFGTKTTAVGKSMQKVGKTATTHLTLPIVGVGFAIAKMAGDFEASMNRVGAISGATGTAFDGLKDQAKKLGRTTQFSASQAADAMNFLAMAGFNVEQITAALPGTLQLAAAGNLDLAQAADIVSNVLTGYRLKAEQIGPVNDVLAKTFTSTNTNLQMLGESFKFIGPVAAGMGIRFTNTAAAIGLLGNAGIQASMAGTVLRGTLVRITEANDPMGKALNSTGEQIKALGLNFFDSQGNVKDFTGIVKELQDRGVTAAQVMQIFGQRAGPGMLALVQQGSSALVELEEKLENAGGTAERVAEANMKGFNGQMLKLKSAVEGAAIAIAESGFLEFLTGMAEKLTEVFSKLAETSPELLKLGTIIAGVVAAIGPLLIGTGFMIEGFGSLITASVSLTKGLASVAVGFINLQIAGGPLLWILEALILTVGILVIDWEAAMEKLGISSESTLGKIFIKLQNMQTTIKQFSLFILSSIDWMVTGLVNLFEKGRELISGIWRELVSAILEGNQMIIEGVAWMAEGLAKIPIIGKAFEGLAVGLNFVSNAIQGVQDKLVAGVHQAEQHTSVLGWMNTALEETIRLENERAGAHKGAAEAIKEEVEATSTAIETMQETGTFLADKLAAGIDENKQAPLAALEDMFMEMDVTADEFAETEGFDSGLGYSESYAAGVAAGQPAIQAAASDIAGAMDTVVSKIELTQEQVELSVGQMFKVITGLTGITDEAAAAIAKIAAGPVPSFQHGGVVTSPMIAKVGEVPEVIIPLSKMGKMGGGGNVFNVHFHSFISPGQADMRLAARKLKEYLDQEAARGEI